MNYTKLKTSKYLNSVIFLTSKLQIPVYLQRNILHKIQDKQLFKFCYLFDIQASNSCLLTKKYITQDSSRSKYLNSLILCNILRAGMNTGREIRMYLLQYLICTNSIPKTETVFKCNAIQELKQADTANKINHNKRPICTRIRLNFSYNCNVYMNTHTRTHAHTDTYTKTPTHTR